MILQGFVSFTQQIVELCEGYRTTFTYYTSSNEPGTNEWMVNNQYYYSDSLTITWDTTGTQNISVIRYSDGCPSTPETFVVYVKPCSTLLFWVPNTFTPNGDEHNNEWGPVFSNLQDINYYNLLIFNRWGNIIWESNSPNAKWDGYYNNHHCLDGVYTWKIVFGVKTTDEIKQYCGFLTLIR